MDNNEIAGLRIRHIMWIHRSLSSVDKQSFPQQNAHQDKPKK